MSEEELGKEHVGLIIGGVIFAVILIIAGVYTFSRGTVEDSVITQDEQQELSDDLKIDNEDKAEKEDVVMESEDEDEDAKHAIEEEEEEEEEKPKIVEVPITPDFKKKLIASEEQEIDDALRLRAVKKLAVDLTAIKFMTGVYPETPKGIFAKDILCMSESGFQSACGSGSSDPFIEDPSLEDTEELCGSESISKCNYAYKKIDDENFEIYVYFETAINNHTGTGLFVLTEGTHGGLAYIPKVGFEDYYEDLRLISPNGGEVLVKGGSFVIEWESTNYTRGVDIFLMKDGVFQNELPFARNNEPGENSVLWDPVETTAIDIKTLERSDGPGGGDYKIYIWGQGEINMDMSDNTFSIITE